MCIERRVMLMFLLRYACVISSSYGRGGSNLGIFWERGVFSDGGEHIPTLSLPHTDKCTLHKYKVKNVLHYLPGFPQNQRQLDKQNKSFQICLQLQVNLWTKIFVHS